MSKREMTWGWTGRPAPLADVQACVGKGWHPLVERLVTDLFDLGWDGTVYQVKEKFGGLRFYIEGGSDAIFARIDAATAESYRACERCGKPGVLREDRDWVLTLCDEHAERSDG